MVKNSDYFKKVYLIVSKIPRGKVTTYGVIAEVLGDRRHARQVGYALHDVVDTDIPCHRVVNRKGELSGSIHFATPTLMRELLESEDIEFKNGNVNLKKHLWIPEIVE